MRGPSSAAVLILASFMACGGPPEPPSDDAASATPPDVPASPAPQRPPTLHVSPTGSDAGTCTAATPCRQIRRALQLATPGDAIGVANGSYLGFDVSNKNGTAAAPIAIVAPGRMAEITVTTDRSDNRDTIFITSSSYIELDGLRVFRANRVAVRISNSSHITVRNCVLGNNATLGILTGHSDDLVIEDNDVYGSVTSHGIYTANSGDRPTIRRNRVHDNAVNGIHMNGDQYEPPGDGIISGALVEANVIYNNGRNGGAGISMDGVQDSIVRNNLIYDNLGSGIRAYAEDGAAGPRGLQILHNTVHLPVVGGTGLSIRQSAGPNTLRNNILITRNPDRSGLKFGDRHDVEINAANSDYNVVERITPDDDETVYTLAQWRSQGYERNSVSATMASLWINPTNGDHHLAASSPAIDRGQTLAGVTRDIEGVTRPQGAASDIGAYERRP